MPISFQFHTRLPCLSPTPGAYLNSCPSCLWCHPTISSSVIPFSSFLQSFPTSGSFPKSQFFTSGGQSVRVSASASVLPMHIQDWSLLVLTGCISLQSKRLLSIFSNTTGQKHLFFGIQPSLWSHSHFMVHPSSTRVCSKSCPLSWWCHLRTKIIIDTVEFFKIYF